MKLLRFVTAVCWAGSSIFFTSTSKQIGAIAVNRIRLLFAVGLILIAHVILTGQLLPLNAAPYRWLWLGLSGIVGLILGDTFLFQAYKLIGFRLGTLIMAGVPVISSLGAWIFLGEQLDLKSLIGIVICVAGIVVVVMERPAANANGASHHERRQYLLGILFAIGGALGQAGGLILAKMGLADNFPSISGVMIRMLVAMLIMWLITIAMGQVKQTLQKLRCASVTRDLIGGSVVGPFIGVWLSQIAVQNTYVGIASTLMALTPVIMLPVSKWFYKEHISPRAFFGTIIALVGVAIIFL